jgi:TolB-like protein
MGIFKQLRERRLFQIALSYAAIGWAVLQVVDQLADRGILPEILYKLVLIWVLLGIPASILIGWHHGERGEQRAPMSEIALLVVLALFALGMSASTVSRARAEKQFANRLEDQLDLRTIAVRYFTDTSPDSAYQYLADGFTEDLIATLSQVQGLNVISRNGALQFRGVDAPPEEVGKAFKAGIVIDGSLQPRGKQLRLVIDLYDGQSGSAMRDGRVTVDFDPSDELTQRDSVAERTDRKLREYLGEEIRMQRLAAGTRNQTAWTLVQRGEKARKDADAAVRARDMAMAEKQFAVADSLLAQAEQLDKEWAEPSTARAAIWYKQARLAGSEPATAVKLIETAVGHADEALRRSKTAGRAYELRGTANYFRWLLKVEDNATAQEALLKSAQTDLETALRYDQQLASAHSTLSHLYNQIDDMSNSVIEAEKALDADAYLEFADVVLLRLFQGSVRLQSFTKAKNWCETGVSRFPDNSQLASCPLRLLITPAVDAGEIEIDTAWAIAARAAAVAPPARAPYERVENEMQVAGAIARVADHQQSKALQDSARSVLQRAHAAATEEVDPTRSLLQAEAYVWVLLHEEERAIDALYQHAAVNPQAYARTRGESSWYWRALEDNPRYRSLMGMD